MFSFLPKKWNGLQTAINFDHAFYEEGGLA
jgi:hypothetical protein